MTTTRRAFLATGGAGLTTLLAAGSTIPAFLQRTAFASASAPRDDRVLVIVQLSGGNDGLNTVIPYRDDIYHRLRPSLAVAPGQVHALTDELALHPNMAALKGLYDEAQLSVISNVGYPNPDRSHFRSMDIWHTASLEPKKADDGWLGRVVERQPDGQTPYALHLDGQSLPLALRAQGVSVPSIRDIEAFRLAGDMGELRRAIGAQRDRASDDLQFVQRVALSSCANAQRLERVDRESSPEASYPAYGLANRLGQIADLIAADYGARVYYTSLGGFDTHARQGDAHPLLLRELSESVAAFQRDLTHRRIDDRVVPMTFSEFGRRVAENAGRGTDHGAAAPMMLVGSPVRSGVLGKAPDLKNLLEGDVRHEIDFRSVYSSVLKDWLGVRPEPILGGRFKSLELLTG